jgi:hypothetical protein
MLGALVDKQAVELVWYKRRIILFIQKTLRAFVMLEDEHKVSKVITNKD